MPTPWPCFLFVASEKALASKEQEIRSMAGTSRGFFSCSKVEVTKTLCDEFKVSIRFILYQDSRRFKMFLLLGYEMI